MASIPTKKPVTKRINGRALAHAVGGKEQDYPTYKFSGKYFYERPKHNPFKDL